MMVTRPGTERGAFEGGKFSVISGPIVPRETWVSLACWKFSNSTRRLQNMSTTGRDQSVCPDNPG